MTAKTATPLTDASDRARLIEALHELINACNPMPGKGVGIMDDDYPLPKCRSLLRELEGK